jgi:hypothetical protein
MYICNIVVQEPLDRIVKEPNDIMCIDPQLALCELKGCLVVSYINGWIYTVDMWFLKDFENGVWSKEHMKQIKFIVRDLAECAQPLLVFAMWDLIKDVQ